MRAEFSNQNGLEVLLAPVDPHEVVVMAAADENIRDMIGGVRH
jgi:hypothetical protein